MMTMTEQDPPTIPESEMPSPEQTDRRAEREAQAQQDAADGAVTLEALAAQHSEHTIPGVGLAIVPPQAEMQGMAAMAVTLAGANALPVGLRGRPNDVFLILLTARDLGVSTTTAIREFHIIDGKVTLSPKVKLAMVNERGAREGWRVWPDPGNNAESATWHATRDDRPGVHYASTFTLDDARRAKVLGKDKSAWSTYPQRMLSWRAVGYLLDDAFPEVGTGLYSPEEMGATVDSDGITVIDIDGTEALTGMSDPRHRGRSGPSEPEPATDEDKAELRRRIEALPEEGRDAVREAVLASRDREGVEPLVSIDKLIARQLPRWRAIIAAAEADAKRAGWEPPADPATGEMPAEPQPDPDVLTPAVTPTPESPAEPPEKPDAVSVPAEPGNAGEGRLEAAEDEPAPTEGVSVDRIMVALDEDAAQERILEAVIAEVKAMPASKVLAELARRAIDPPTAANRDEQRAERQRVLAEYLFRERTAAR